VSRFGDNGVLDLSAQFDRNMTGLTFRVTSPPVVFEDTVIVGGGGGEGPRPQAPGHVRGYDVYTGKRKWIFHTIPHPGEFGYDTWPQDAWQRNGAANNWAGMSMDLKRGWLFVSTGSASFDFWGGDRHGDNLFSDCVIALDARKGRRIWHYQTVHHDVWDYDLPAQPALLSVRQGGRMRDAVAQVTKTSFLFLLDRETGKPMFPVEERSIPASDVDDEKLSATQPFPLKPAPFSRLEVNEDLITDISSEARAFALQRFQSVRGGVPFAPPSRQGTIYSPGTLGGVLWMLIGYNSFWFSTGTFLGASVFAPLALLGIHRGMERRNLVPFALGGLAMGLVILGSHGQHALQGCPGGTVAAGFNVEDGVISDQRTGTPLKFCCIGDQA
jgi:quinoprotein glucose dehydrogenase